MADPALPRYSFNVQVYPEVDHPLVSVADESGDWCKWADVERHLRAVEAAHQQEMERPKIVCLCGSTRFIEQFAVLTWILERQGAVVLGCTLLPMWFCGVPSHFGEATGTKAQCDDLHLRKIDLADEVLVIDIYGYIGESTRNEIAYATKHGTPVKYLSHDTELISAVLTAAEARRPALDAAPPRDGNPATLTPPCAPGGSR
jgi:hypothetical protein